MITSRRYRILQRHYEKKDGIGAIGLYLLSIALMFLQGYLYTTKLDASILRGVQIAFSVFDVFIVLLLVKIAKKRLSTVGITKRLLLRSIRWGVAGAVLLVAAVMFYRQLSSHGKISFQMVSVVVLIMFVIGGIAEELLFRGYIETRLSGLTKNRILCSCITGVMFLSIHYPAKWVATGAVSFTILSLFYVGCLLALHFLCDYIYRKTNCLCGSMVLHIIYNIGTATLVVL